jgi:hypothetical protein
MEITYISYSSDITETVLHTHLTQQPRRHPAPTKFSSYLRIFKISRLIKDISHKDYHILDATRKQKTQTLKMLHVTCNHIFLLKKNIVNLENNRKSEPIAILNMCRRKQQNWRVGVLQNRLLMYAHAWQ